MTMPEAAVNEDDFTARSEHQIRLAGKILAVQPEAKAEPVDKVVDTTGAGDCFVGALSARLSAGAALPEAVRYANAAASIAVERLGATPSMPTPREVARRLARA